MKKLLLLLSTMMKNPIEFYDRIATIIEVKTEQFGIVPPQYTISRLEAVYKDFSVALQKDITPILNEPQYHEIKTHVQEGISKLSGQATFTNTHNSDFSLAEFCYVACRALKPTIVVETGVAYGVNSAFILKALDVNGQGTLYSVDLPPLAKGADNFVGALVPSSLTARWSLHRGTSKRLLPLLLSKLSHTDIFIHDSLHTLKNMRFELNAAAAYLSHPSIVIADDIEGNSAFLEWSGRNSPVLSAHVQESNKTGLFGFGLCL